MTTHRAPAECPGCRAGLDPKATACDGCGRKLVAADLVPVVKTIACDLTLMCDRPAKVSIIVDGKRINGCLQCYHAHQDAELRAANSEEAVQRRNANRRRLERNLGIERR